MSDALFGMPFRRLFLSPPILREWPGSSAPPMDWLETPSSHIFRFSVPGFGREDIKVQLEEDNILRIRGEAPAAAAREEQEKDVVWHVAERGLKEGFSMEVPLPEGVRVNQIKAQVENGVLTVLVPKEPAPAKPKPRAIPLSSKL